MDTVLPIMAEDGATTAEEAPVEEVVEPAGTNRAQEPELDPEAVAPEAQEEAAETDPVQDNSPSSRRLEDLPETPEVYYSSWQLTYTIKKETSK